MILVIDTSSARSAIAMLRTDLSIAGSSIAWPLDDETNVHRDIPLPARVKELTEGHRLTRVAVAVGPGSFTGTRVGVSFGLGLAMGLRIPIVPLGTLELQAARATEPVLAMSEAGRGRIYHLAPGGRHTLADVADVPTDWPAVGWLKPATRAALQARGIHMPAERELRSIGGAAAILLEKAREVAYGSLEIEYMQSFSVHH